MEFKAFEKFVAAARKLCSLDYVIAADGEKVYTIVSDSDYTAVLGMYAAEQQPFIISVETAVRLVNSGKAIKAKTISLVDGVAYIDTLKVPYEQEDVEKDVAWQVAIAYGDKLDIDSKVVKRMLGILREDDRFLVMNIFVDRNSNIFATDGFALVANFPGGSLQIADTMSMIPVFVKFLDVAKATFFALPDNHGCFATDNQHFVLYRLSSEVNFTNTAIRQILEPTLYDTENGHNVIINKNLISFLYESNTSYYRKLDVRDSFAKIIRINVPSNKNKFHTEDDLTIFEQEIESDADFLVNGNFLYQIVKVFDADSVTIFQGKRSPLLVKPNNNTNFMAVLMPMARLQ